MNKVLSINSNLNDETLFRLNKTNKIGDYFTTEIKEREALIKRLNKYIVAFDYTEKILNCFVCSKWKNIYYFFF